MIKIYIPLNIQRFAEGYIETPGTRVSGGDYMYARINWSAYSNGSSANSSNVYADLYIKKGAATTTGTWTGVINLGGNESGYSYYGSIGTSWVKIHSYSITRGHYNDGTGECWIGALVNGPSGTTCGGYSINYGEVKTLDTIPRYFSSNPTLSVQSKTETSVTLKWTTSENASVSQYRIGSSGNWIDVETNINKSSGTMTISNLTPNTEYTIYGDFKRADSGLWAQTKPSVSVTTYAYPYITGANNFTVGNANTITFYNPLSRNITIHVQPNGSGTWYGGDTSTGTSISGYNNSGWRDIWYQNKTNGTSNTYRVRLTYGSHTNTTGYNYTYTISESANSGECKPTFSDFSLEDTNSAITTLTGSNQKIILGYSNIKSTISTSQKATANKYASMSSYKMTINGNNPDTASYSSDSNVTMTINNVKNNSVTVTAYDSRGFSRPVTKSLTTVNYTAPVINVLGATLTRSNNGIGENVTLAFSGTYWNGNFGATTNAIETLTYQYKTTDSNTYLPSTPINILPDMTTSGSTFSYNHLIQGPTSGHGFDISTTYNIKINWADKLNSGSFVLTLGSGQPKISIAENGVAINQKFDTSGDGTFQVNGNILLAENNFINGISSNTGNTHHLIRATDGYSALGDSRYKTGIWGSNIVLMAPMSIANSGTEGQGITNGSGVSIIRDHNNQNVTVDATGNGLYLGFQHTNFLDLLNNKGAFDSNGNLGINGNVYVGNKNNKVATEGYVTENTGGGILRLPSGTSYSDARATGKTCMWMIANNMPSDGPSANTNYGLAMVINPTGTIGYHFATVGIFVSDWHSTLYVHTANGGWVSK